MLAEARLSNASSVTAAIDGKGMSFYPSFEEIIAGDDENGLLAVRRSFRSILSNTALFFVTLIVVYAINIALHGYYIPPWVPVLHGLSPRWLAIIPTLVLLEILRKYHNDIYVFHSHYLNHYGGRLSLKTLTPSVKYVDILAVRVKQDIWGRILDYGNVELDTAATAGVELTMTGVRAPSELAAIADRFRMTSITQGAVGKRPVIIDSSGGKSS